LIYFFFSEKEEVTRRKEHNTIIFAIKITAFSARLSVFAPNGGAKPVF